MAFLRKIGEVILKNTPSSSMKPDLDWSQVRETVRMLNLAVAQIISSMHEGDKSIETMGESFTMLAQQLRDIGHMGSALSSNKDNLDTMLEMVQTVSDKVQRFVVAFQFYDKLSQRLTHVSTDLTDLAELVGDASRIYNPNEWQMLQQQIRGRYSTPEEHRMFDALMNGASLAEALSISKEKQTTADNDSVDLF
jgi:hypothetical protein